MSRLILVSNRLPAAVKRKGNESQLAYSGHGGLLAALGPVHEEGSKEGLWFGIFKDTDDPDVVRGLEQRGLVAVPVDAADARRHYRGYSNGALWPLFHYLQDHVDFAGGDFEAYRRVNVRFADEIASRARPDDRIWVHDYHLLLLPSLLRQRLPEARIGFFLHIPFPSSEVFRLLPQREEILRGLLGADLIGVHTYDYARHLMSSFRRVLAVEFDSDGVAEDERRCRIGVFPMGIDVLGFQRRVASPRIPPFVKRFRQRLRDRHIVLGVDRLDYTKGLPLKLEAYRRLLELRPRWRTEAVLVQIATPTRQNIAPYRRLKEQVEQMVGEINGAFESDGLVPVHYLYRAFPPETLAAFYQMADVAMVTPLRDGMNLVAKEYVSCRTSDTGVLILSEFAGAASEMGEAIQVNPRDIEACAWALDSALLMDPKEQASRMKVLRQRIIAWDVRKWAAGFLSALEAVGPTPSAASLAADAEGSWMESLYDGFQKASRSLLVLDYDGTLTKLARHPDLAVPDAETRGLLRRLARRPGVEIAVVSGRNRHTLEEWLGDLPLSLVAEHGCHLRWRGSREWIHLLPDADFSWIRSVQSVLDEFAARTSGAWVETKSASLAWHYREVEPAFGSWQARELANHISGAFQRSPIEVLHGSKVVEVRQQGLDKGMVLSVLCGHFGPTDLMLLAGDDRTDEDMFQKAPPEAWTIKIGSGLSHARFRLQSVPELHGLLERLAHAAAQRSRKATPMSSS